MHLDKPKLRYRTALRLWRRKRLPRLFEFYLDVTMKVVLEKSNDETSFPVLVALLDFWRALARRFFFMRSGRQTLRSWVFQRIVLFLVGRVVIAKWNWEMRRKHYTAQTFPVPAEEASLVARTIPLIDSTVVRPLSEEEKDALARLIYPTRSLGWVVGLMAATVQATIHPEEVSRLLVDAFAAGDAKLRYSIFSIPELVSFKSREDAVCMAPLVGKLAPVFVREDRDTFYKTQTDEGGVLEPMLSAANVLCRAVEHEEPVVFFVNLVANAKNEVPGEEQTRFVQRVLRIIGYVGVFHPGKALRTVEALLDHLDLSKPEIRDALVLALGRMRAIHADFVDQHLTLWRRKFDDGFADDVRRATDFEDAYHLLEAWGWGEVFVAFLFKLSGDVSAVIQEKLRSILGELLGCRSLPRFWRAMSREAVTLLLGAKSNAHG